MTQGTVRAWEAGAPPAPSGRTGRFEKVLFLPDIHCGDQDDRAVALALQVIRYFRPNRIIQLGDVLDFYGLSRFDKNPDHFAFRLQRELDIQHALYRRIREISPRSFKQQLKGNHEHRGTLLMWKNPSLAELNAIQLPELMKLGQLGWEPKLHEAIQLAEGKFIARHGTVIRAHAGASARGELERSLVSGISGHTHRQGTYSHSSEGMELQWTEAGCLQNNPPEWMNSRQNWQQGVVLGEFEVDGNAFEITPIRFRRSYRCLLGGKELSA